MYTISVVIGINEKNEVCLPNKEYTSGHGYEKTNMVGKYKYFYYHLKLHRHLQKQIGLPNKECINDQRYERRDMVAKCKIFLITRILEFIDFWKFYKYHTVNTTLTDLCSAKSLMAYYFSLV